MMPTIEQIKPLISRRTKAIITAVAIILNLLIIVFFLLMELNLDDTSLIRHLRKVRTVLKKRKPKEEWAALSPKASQLGAPIILVQAPQQQIQPQLAQPQSTQQAPMPTPHTDNEQNKNAEKATIASAQSPENKKVQETQLQEPTQLVENRQILKTDTQEKTDNSPLEQAIKAALAKKLKEAAHHNKPNSANTHKVTQDTHAKINNTASSSVIKPKTQINPMLPQPTKTLPPPKLTFAQLVKGFTEHLKHEGEYTLSMEGKSGAKATEQQLRVGRFLQKIIQCMQTSWKINRNRYPLNHRVLADIVVRVVINKDGTLNNLIIQKTSGRQIIDKYVLDILTDASKSFPPIPDYLHQEVCVITCNWEKIPLPEGPTGYTITH